MNIQRYRTDDGWPGVRWDQEVPTGDTVHARLRRWQIGAGLGLGALLAYYLTSDGVSGGWATFWGCVVAFAIIAPDAFSRMGAGIGGQGGGGHSKTDWERDLLARWKATPIFRTEKRCAELSVDLLGKQFVFTLMALPAREVIGRCVLDALTSFEVGTADEWFGDAATRELKRLEHEAGHWVVVTAVEGQGVMRIAESGRDKASITNLLLVLSDEFIAKRKELRAKLEELGERQC